MIRSASLALVVLVGAAALLAVADAKSHPIWRMPHRPATKEHIGRTIRVQNALPSNTSTAGLWGGIVALGEYYTEVTVGGQQFFVQLDTGSSTLAVPSSSCSCGSHADAPYTPSNNYAICEHSYECEFYVPYGDGSHIAGRFVNDTVGVADFAVPYSAVGTIDSMSDGFESFQLDGIFGVGYNFLNCFPQVDNYTYCPPTVLSHAMATTGYNGVFAMCLSDTWGRWDVGELDPQYQAGDITYLSLQPSVGTHYGYYQVGMTNVQVGGLPSGNYAPAAGTVAIVDSGTTLLVVPSAQLQSIAGLIAQLEPPAYDTLLGGQECVKLTDDQIAQWPVVSFTVASNDPVPVHYTVRVPPQNYLVEQQGYMCFGMVSMDSDGPPMYILGDVAMRGYYCVFDQAQNRVGFAPVGTCASPGPAPRGDSRDNKGNPNVVWIIVGLVALLAILGGLAAWRHKANTSRGMGQVLLRDSDGDAVYRQH